MFFQLKSGRYRIFIEKTVKFACRASIPGIYSFGLSSRGSPPNTPLFPGTGTDQPLIPNNMGKNFSIGKPSIGYKGKLTVIVIGLVIGLSSLVFTNIMARQLRKKELNEIQVWSYAMNQNYDKMLEAIDNNITIPSVITDENLVVIRSHLIPEHILKDPQKLRREIEKMSMDNMHFEITTYDGNRFLIFYGESLLLKMLRFYPYVELSIIGTFILFVFIAFRTSKQGEQNRIWVGMAKETAHQLGTPTSSLLGWIEYLRSQQVDSFVIEEMNKDLTRLLKVVDRFSKIGATTLLVPRNITELVNNAVSYFRVRLPKNVELRCTETSSEPMQALVNEALFEWVIENLLKNALDALQGKGVVEVRITNDAKWIYIDVKDTGKGISKNNFKTIFSPGYTTKTRGWGLGLSLSKRIIKEYHKGRIFVAESEIYKGTTMRIMLRRL